MIFRLIFLLLVTFLGALVYCSRHEPETGPLFRLASKKTLSVTLWVILPYFVMVAIESIWIDA